MCWAPSTSTTRASPASSACSTRRARWKPVQGAGAHAQAAGAPVARHRRAACAGRGAASRRSRATRPAGAAGLCSTRRLARCWRRSRCRRPIPHGPRTGSTQRARPPDGRHLRARLGVQDADRRHGARGGARGPRQDLRRAPAADGGPLHHQGPASAGHGRSACARSSCIPPTSAPACWRWKRAPSGSAHSSASSVCSSRCARKPARGAAAAAEALGQGRDHHHRLRAWAGGGAAAVRGRRGGARQRRRAGYADAS